ncbi:MAG: bifunctional adenosylcobinamide kinase/adenosylcobinamide-phosphate guanylyltransferase [Methylococcaceae bacterium]|nr:bifunctional adenosylcobinamide kinase/adenosylcobinamide-phosphate guanylyltransferase [Methylococcaceae bacterium]MDZ4155803.1 bifunctional adenosylcobinamide kinase/adenosylcobinamide-phosphate guanylyltransferase [Methylococcales bacterium]MDP2391848.1 bifunctional adenosylcobinamide kinase/adenosylcobinamide-phosphate guanylyltransferase [Methylococcaceae bacterium]MDP3018913.1 bifunctional adenosylcobinamide kinase/adenosylcobinamide-phosphate guanylyltransferase [Methylococcaceae bacte
MKTLFIGGIKSGKSRLAESHILAIAGNTKPYYLATTEFFDDEMQARIQVHKQQRQDAFITIEEPLKLFSAVQSCPGPVLIECISMWLNNQLYHQIPEVDTLQELAAVLKLPNDLVLVHNEVGLGIIPDNPLARQFVDLSGRAAQLMAQHCDHVFFCSAGLKLQMK